MIAVDGQANFTEAAVEIERSGLGMNRQGHEDRSQQMQLQQTQSTRSFGVFHDQLFPMKHSRIGVKRLRGIGSRVLINKDIKLIKYIFMDVTASGDCVDANVNTIGIASGMIDRAG